MKRIPLTQGKFAIIDDEDFERVSKYKWFYHLGYAKHGVYDYKKKNNIHLLLHRFILQVNDPLVSIDHKDRNGLDNRKQNLRICTQSQNNMNRMVKNTNGYKGLKYLKTCSKNGKQYLRKKPYQAVIHVSGKKISLGYFSSAEDAARAYNEGAKRIHGEFAKLNEVNDP